MQFDAVQKTLERTTKYFYYLRIHIWERIIYSYYRIFEGMKIV